MISTADHQRLAAAIAAAEQETSGEIVCVIARQSSTYSAMPMTYAALIALLLPVPLLELTDLSAERIYLAQLGCFMAVLMLLSLSFLRLAIVPRTVKRAQAEAAAVHQFRMRHVSRTAARTGLLIYVSIAERVARIVADEGISSRVPQSEWEGAIQLIVDHARRGEVADGCIAAIEVCGGLLHQYCPARTGNPNELPDRVYVI